MHRSMDGQIENLGGYPIIGVPSNNNLLFFENGAWIYVTISDTGTITGIANVGTGQGIFRNTIGNTAFFYSLSTTSNMTYTLSGNTIVFDVAPNQTNIQSITSVTNILDVNATLRLPTAASITPTHYIGIDAANNIGYFDPIDSDISNIINVGGAPGQVFRDIITGTAALRTIGGDSNILVTTAGDVININLNTALNISSINATVLTLNAILNVPTIATITPGHYLGIDASNNIGIFTSTNINNVSNVGGGSGQIFRDITSNTANLRTISGDSNILVNTSGDVVTVNLNGSIDVSAIISSALTLNASTISVANIPLLTPEYSIGIVGGNLCYFTTSAALTITSAGTGDSLIFSSTPTNVALKSINTANSILYNDTAGTITISLDTVLNDTRDLYSGTGTFVLHPANIYIPNITYNGTDILYATTTDGTSKVYYTDFFNKYFSAGPYNSIISGPTGNSIYFKSLGYSSAFTPTIDGGSIYLDLNPAQPNINSITSGAGTLTINNTMKLNSVANNPSAVNILALDGSNNITYTNIAGSVNIYNSDGTLTAATRTINPYLSANSTIVYNNINPQYINNTTLLPGGSTDEVYYSLYQNSAGQSRGKYEASTWETRNVVIGALGNSGNYKVFYTCSAQFAGYAGWMMKVYLYEDSASILTPFVAYYKIFINSNDNTPTYQTVYPEYSTPNNSGYILELNTGNQYIFALRVRNMSSGSLLNTLSAKIEHYGVTTNQSCSTTIISGNQTILTIGPSLAYTLPVNWLLNTGQNGANSPPSFLWNYTYWPRLVKIFYSLSAVSANAGQNTTITFRNNGIVCLTQIMRSTTNNAISTISGFFFIDPYPAGTNGQLVNGLNALTITSSSIVNVNFTAMQYTVNFEFLQK